MRTEIVAYLGGVDDTEPILKLHGYVEGPIAGHARTMPHRVLLSPHGSTGGALVATAELHETCFWNPVPHWYEAHVTLGSGDEAVAETRRVVGVRPLSVTAEGLRLNGRPFVLRAVAADTLSDELLKLCLSENSRLAVTSVSDDQLRRASEAGLPLIVTACGSQDEVIAELRRLARWPAVMVAVIEATGAVTAELRLECPNVLLAEAVTADRPLADWAHLAVVDDDENATAPPTTAVLQRLRCPAADSLDERIAVAGTFDTPQDGAAEHGHAVGCIV
ncbi:MAG: hypothetical protein R3C10_11580 [Pirellulales bacterium]